MLWRARFYSIFNLDRDFYQFPKLKLITQRGILVLHSVVDISRDGTLLEEETGGNRSSSSNVVRSWKDWLRSGAMVQMPHDTAHVHHTLTSIFQWLFFSDVNHFIPFFVRIVIHSANVLSITTLLPCDHVDRMLKWLALDQANLWQICVAISISQHHVASPFIYRYWGKKDEKTSMRCISETNA